MGNNLISHGTPLFRTAKFARQSGGRGLVAESRGRTADVAGMYVVAHETILAHS